MLGMKNHFGISDSIEISEVDIAGVACIYKNSTKYNKCNKISKICDAALSKSRQRDRKQEPGPKKQDYKDLTVLFLWSRLFIHV